VLDQKAKGIVDPLLYTAEDIEDPTGEAPFGGASWRQSQTPADPSQMGDRPGVADIPSDGKWSPKIDPSQGINHSNPGLNKGF
jgi:hypothetical protein